MAQGAQKNIAMVATAFGRGKQQKQAIVETEPKRSTNKRYFAAKLFYVFQTTSVDLFLLFSTFFSFISFTQLYSIHSVGSWGGGIESRYAIG